MRVIVGALLIFIISSSSSLGDPIRNRCDSGEDLYQLRAQKNAQNDADVKHHALHKQKDKHSNVNVNKNTNVVDDSDGVDDELEERIAIPAPQIRRKRPSLNAEIQPAIRFHQHQPRHHHRNHDDISEEQRKVHKDKNVNQNINVNLMENEEEGEDEDDEAKLTRRTLTPSNFSSTSDKNSETPRIPKHQNLNVLQKLITETVKESAKIDADSVNENSNKNQNEQTTQAPRHDHELRKKRLRKIGRLFKNRLTAGKKVIDIELESVDNAVTKQRPRDISKNANQNSNVNSNTNAQEQPELVSPSRRSSGNRNVNKNSNINTIEMRSLHVPESHRNENKNVNSNTNVMQDEDEDDFGDHENDDRPLRRSQPGRSHKTSKNENVNKNVNTNVDDIDDDNDDLDDGIGKRRSLGQRSSNKNSNSNSNVNSAVDNLENEDDDGNVDEEDDLSREERQRAQRHRGRPARRNYGSNRNVNKNSNVNTVEARLLNIPHRNQNKNVNVNSNSNSNVDSLQADEQPDLVNDKELDDEENAEPLEEEEEQQLYKPRRRSRNQNSNSNSNTNTNDLAGDLSDIYVAKRRSLTGSIGQRVDDDNNKNENVNSNVNSNSVQQLAKGEENQGNKHAPRQQKRVRKVRKPLRHQNANSSSTKSDNSAHPEAKVSAPVVNNDISLKKVQSDVVKRDRVVGAQPETLKQHIHQQPKPADNSLVLNKNKNTNVNSADPSADDVHAE